MRNLPLFHAVGGRPVVVAGEGDGAEAKRRLVREAGGICVAPDARGGARLAFLAMDDPEALVAELRAAGLLVNVADRPELCDFIVPALVSRDPVTLAISSAGSSAALAKAVKERLDALLPPNLGALAQALLEARPALAVAAPDGRDRRQLLAALLAPGAALDPLADHPDAAAAVHAALQSPERPPQARVVHLDCPPDPEDLTLRGLRLLAAADAVVGTAAPAIMALARRDSARFETLPEPPPAGLVVVLR